MFKPVDNPFQHSISVNRGLSIDFLADQLNSILEGVKLTGRFHITDTLLIFEVEWNDFCEKYLLIS